MRSIKLIRKSLIMTSLCAAISGNALAQQGYEIIDIGTLPDTVVSDPRAINEQGHALADSSNIYNQNIRFDLVDDDFFPGIDGFDDLTIQEWTFIRDQLNSPESLGSVPIYQKLATEIGFYFDGMHTNLAELFDITDPETGVATDSVTFRASDLNNYGGISGRVHGPFTRIEGTNSEGEERMFFAWQRFPQAVYTNGSEYTILPGEEDLYFGGTSGAYALNDNNQVVGYASVASNEELDGFYNRCTNPEREDSDGNIIEIALEPLEVCMWRLWYQSEPMVPGRDPFFNEEAYLWNLDSSGEIISQQSLGFAFDPEQDDAENEEVETRMYRSQATDINIHGVAVGTSWRYTNFGAINRATLFDPELGAQRAIEGNEFENRSHLTVINDHGIAAGYASRVLTQFTRSRLFFIDTNASDPEPVFPEGFFSDSGWLPRDINNNNQIVGRADTENTMEPQRRTAGFLYDIDSDEIINLNDYLPCNSGYWVYDAKAINDSGEILASALTTVTVELSNGYEFEGDVSRAILLRPSADGGCSQPEDGEDTNTRKGAAFSPLTVAVLALFALITLRRRFRNQ